jgi:hypothetical protein
MDGRLASFLIFLFVWLVGWLIRQCNKIPGRIVSSLSASLFVVDIFYLVECLYSETTLVGEN